MRSAVLALFLLTTLATAWPSPAAAIQPGGLYGGTVTVAVLDDVSLDPLAATDADAVPQSLAYDSLAKLSAVDNTPTPWLAKNWSVGANTITFYLRSGAMWADGTPITAADVAWSYQKHAPSGVVASADTVANTVTFTFTSNAGRFWAEWAYLPIAWKSGASTLTSSGPFSVAEQVAGDHVTLEANGNHWNGRPYLDAVVYKVYADVVAAACGLIDREATMNGFPLVPNDLTDPRDCPVAGANRTLLNEAHLSVARNPGLTQLYLAFNTENVPLNDPDLRRGIVQALDKDLYGLIEPAAYVEIADSLVVPGNFHWFNSSVQKYRVDKVIVGARTEANFDRVNRELDLAGFLDIDSDGWREDRSGNDFSVTILAPSAADRALGGDIRKFTIAQNLWTNLGRIGIQPTLDATAIWDIPDRIAADDFDLAIYLETVGKDPWFYYDLFHSSKVASGSNLVNLDDADADALLTSLKNEIDEEDRQQLGKDVQGWVAEEVPYAPILHYKAIDVHEKETFTGWVNSVGGQNNFWTFVSLHVFEQGPLSVSLSLSDVRVDGGGTAQVVVVVTDSEGNGVDGVEVELTSTGTFATPSGFSSGGGRFETTFTAPAVTADTDVRIAAAVAAPGYDSASATAAVAVGPPERHLRVSISRSVEDAQLDSDEEADLKVTVIDSKTLLPVAGATVRLSVSPENFGGVVDPATGTTDASGEFDFTFVGDVSVETYFQITAEASAPGYETAASNPSTIIVAAHAGTFEPAPSTPGLDTVTLVAATAGVALLYARLQRRRKK